MMKLKVCGMKHNLAEVAQLRPDYLGFIFYEKSPRNVSDKSLDWVEAIPACAGMTKTGVFVNASIDFIFKKVKRLNLNVIQLHGEESPDFCKSISTALDVTTIKIWKVFSIKDTFNFETLKPYEPYIDAFLFDTKGKDKGGNGYTFDWSVLKDYNSEKPIILSGGIGPEHIQALQQLLKTNLPIHAIDVNSKFEIEPGLKDVEKLGAFMEELERAFHRNS